MKTNRNTIAALTTAAIAWIAGASTSQAANRTLILLQENSNGKSYMTDIIPPGAARTAADAIVDRFVENGEAAKFQALQAGNYQRFINLSDANCTRANLLSQLIRQSREGFTVDLAILGHGGVEKLSLHNGEQLTGLTTTTVINRLTGARTVSTNQGTIRSMLTDARASQGAAFNFKLRLVHMCNCFGGTTNDDWLAIGAKVSVGSPAMDWMPEPMNTFFWNDFVKGDKRVSQAAADSLAATRNLWQFVPGYTTVQTSTTATSPAGVGLTKIQETRQSVLGNGNLIFKDEFQLAVNQSRTLTVQANRTHNLAPLYLVAGQTYAFSASTNDTWNNMFGGITTNANGNAPVLIDPPASVRRFNANMMSLIGERFTRPNSTSPLNFIGGSGFRIGTSRTITAPGHGFVNFFANDIITGYGDNSGSINVTVRRTN
ncbi:MAG: hypothetical protein V4640_07185 [Verrucomicrobiota bacterium]